MLTARSRYLFSICRLDVVDVAYTVIILEITVGRMGAGRGHREDGSEYCLLYLQLPDISFEHHAHRRAS